MSSIPEVRIGATYRVEKLIVLKDVTIPVGANLILLRLESG